MKRHPANSDRRKRQALVKLGETALRFHCSQLSRDRSGEDNDGAPGKKIHLDNGERKQGHARETG